MRAIMPWFAFWALATGLMNRALGDEAQAPAGPEAIAKALEEAGRPGAEHAKLDALAGTWTYTGKLWMDPAAPPVETKGTIERTWVLGGRFLEEKVVGTGFDGKSEFEGQGLLGYDTGRKTYTSTFACTMCTGTCSATGAVDESGKTFTFQTEVFCPLMQKEMRGRDVIRVESEDRVVVESYWIEDDVEIKTMEMVATRKR